MDTTESSHSDTAAPASKTVEADALIHNKVLWAMGAGFVPIPLLDLAAIAAVQVKLLQQLSELYGTTFSSERAEKIIGVLVASVGSGALATRGTASLLKIFPGVGTMAGSLALPAVAAASTYALGKVFVHHFEHGGNLFDFEQDKAKEYFAKAYAEGGKVVAKLKAEFTPAKA